MARVANWVQSQHARLKLNPAERAEHDAIRAVESNAPDANALVEIALRKMYDHSQTFRYGPRFVRLDPEEELQWLHRCVALYGLRNDTADCQRAGPLMHDITFRGGELHDEKAIVRRGTFYSVMNGEAYIQAVLWRRYYDIGEIRRPEGNEMTPDFLITALQNVKPETARAFLADPLIAQRHVPRPYQATIVKELTRQLDGPNDLTAADHLRNEASAQGAARLVPAAHQPKLEEGKAVYDATGTLMENDVPTPDVVLQEIADFLSPRTPDAPGKSSGST